MGNTRAANARELKAYEKLKRAVRRSALVATVNDALAWQTHEAIAFGLMEGEKVPMYPSNLVDRRRELERKVGRFVSLIDDIETQNLGIRLAKNQTDLDIVAPPEATDDQIAKWSDPNLGTHPVVYIIAGIAIVTGAIYAAVKLYQRNNELTAEYNKLLEETDKRYCSVPGSDLCKKWLSRKSEQDYQQKTSIADQAKNELKSIGSGIGSGLSAGLMLALPIAALYLFSRDK